ncbi:MAG TPA: glucodextranase DOMON-like domain-containing protein [Steroidobacteraceae bacterium]|nr:glucodextranase DOMON-like domain-containing protein [Steroidobacteraceae bacterium]
MNQKSRVSICALAAGLALAGAAHADGVKFMDPAGDDKGPGNYIYPTDAAYAPGSFDLVEFEVTGGNNPDFKVTMNQRLNDPWGMGVGFATQMIFIFIDKDGVAGSGHTGSLPGLNIAFAPESAWEKVVILSPQPASRVGAEIKTKAAELASDIVVPRRTSGAGRTISGKVKLDDLGGGDPATWGYQVVVQSNEGFPDKSDLLTRKVNEYEGQHRFGGGNDGNCDPHVMDILAGKGTGAAEEAQAQYDMLKYECGPEGESVKPATLTMVRK